MIEPPGVSPSSNETAADARRIHVCSQPASLEVLLLCKPPRLLTLFTAQRVGEEAVVVACPGLFFGGVIAPQGPA